MTVGMPKLACPACKRSHEAVEWVTDSRARCRHCLVQFDFYPFPALGRSRTKQKPRAVAVGEEASCFYHVSNQAETVCEGCGRFLCQVCGIQVGGETLCANCISQRQKSDPRAVPSRVLWGGVSLATAILPLLMWPITIMSAPFSLFAAIRGWKRPLSVVQPRRWPMVLGGLIATAQIAGWGFLLFTWINASIP